MAGSNFDQAHLEVGDIQCVSTNYGDSKSLSFDMVMEEVEKLHEGMEKFDGIVRKGLEAVGAELQVGDIPCDTTNSGDGDPLLYDIMMEGVKKLNESVEELSEFLRKEWEVLAAHNAQLDEMSASSKGLFEISLCWSKRELVTCVDEIWKRVSQKRGAAIGDGKQLFDPNVKDLVMRGAIAMGMENQIPEMKEMSRICIVAGDDAVHYSSVKSLDDFVKRCLKAIEILPSLQQSHVHECTIISNYQRLKEIFPESFRD